MIIGLDDDCELDTPTPIEAVYPAIANSSSLLSLLSLRTPPPPPPPPPPPIPPPDPPVPCTFTFPAPVGPEDEGKDEDVDAWTWFNPVLIAEDNPLTDDDDDIPEELVEWIDIPFNEAEEEEVLAAFVGSIVDITGRA